jgi:hygromycin-B 7''-O-kinase
MSRVEGETLESVWGNLDFENKVTLIQEIGSLIKKVHSLGIQGLEAIDSHWNQFIERQISLCVDRHRNKGLKERLLSQLPEYLVTAKHLLPHSFTPVLLTGEYTPFNLLVKKISGCWTLSGMIDFGDCMLGFREYDLLGPGAFLIRGDKTLLKEFLISYGYSPDELNSKLSKRLTTLLFLHRFSDLRIQIRIPNWEAQINTLQDLENRVWGLSRHTISNR